MDVSVQFYTTKLGFSVAWKYPDDIPTQIGLKIIEKAHRDQIQLSLTLQPIHPSGWLFIYLTNIDDVYEAYKERGVEIYQEIDDFPWGYREFWLKDPDGNELRFTQEIPHDHDHDDHVHDDDHHH